MADERYVYFIKPVGMDGPVKIGCSSTPLHRLETLLVWSPVKLEILAIAPGDEALERRLHLRFARLHSHGEWFRAEGELVEAIRRIAAGTAVEEAVDLAFVTGKYPRRNPVSPRQRRMQSAAGRLRNALKRADRPGYGYFRLPDDVQDIFERWGIHRGRPGIDPTPDELARIEQVIDSPTSHALWVNFNVAGRLS